MESWDLSLNNNSLIVNSNPKDVTEDGLNGLSPIFPCTESVPMNLIPTHQETQDGKDHAWKDFAPKTLSPLPVI